MNALVTGASGFVGTHLAEHLLAAGDRVLGCSQSGHWREGTPPEITELCELVAWDIRQPPSGELRRRLLDFAPQAIYHLAALADPARCGPSAPSPEAVAANVEGTQHVIELALAIRPLPRLVFTSSSHVYGPVSPASPVVREDQPLRPANGYAMTKRDAEERVSRAVAEHGLPANVARAFHQAGPRQEPRYILSEWCRDLAVRSSVLQVKNLDTWLDLTDVRDSVRAYRLLATHVPPGGNYNVGYGQGRRSGDLLAELLELHDNPVMVEQLSPGPRHEPIADCRALASACGWHPQIELKTTLADTLHYWRRRSHD